MSVLADLLRHAAARRVLHDPESTPEEREEARSVLGLAAPTYKPFCSLDCNREYHKIVVSPDYWTDGRCSNCGAPTSMESR